MPTNKRSKLKKAPSKTCFLITPIDSHGSPTRHRVDQWEELIYRPALGSSYKIDRADKIPAPGYITEQIVQQIVDADLVIVDYTGFNANVMFEVAIRLLTEKPTVHIKEASEKLPFDVHNIRVLSYDLGDLAYPKKLIEGIKQSVKAMNAPGYQPPQLIKEKFDFKKIVADPEKFVKLLIQHMNVQKGTDEEAIVTISEPLTEAYSASVFGLGRKKIVCPKCKTIKYINSFDNPLSVGGVTNSVYASAYFGGNHYRCNNCGTEFAE